MEEGSGGKTDEEESDAANMGGPHFCGVGWWPKKLKFVSLSV